MSNEELSKKELQEELGQIKEAMGLHEQYPSLARWWLVEGVGIGIMLPLLQLSQRGEVPDLLGLALVGVVFIGALIAHRRFVPDTERSATEGGPNLDILHATLILGMIALVIGLIPILDQLDVDRFTVSFVFFSLMAGLGLVNTGITFRAYNIRKPDRYAFYVGGCWLLALAAVTLWIPFLREWGPTVVGLSYAVHGIGSYIVLTRL